MKILYRQSPHNSGEKSVNCQLFDCGISNCYLKHILQEYADKSNTKKRHSHTGFELHLMIKGSQTYESAEGRFCVREGEFLMIPPRKAHRFITAEYPVEKYAVTFSYAPSQNARLDVELADKCCKGKLTGRITERIVAFEEELVKYLPTSRMLIENAVFEIAIYLMRECGNAAVLEKRREQLDAPIDERVELAKQFIIDNIKEPLQIGEVAAYCYLSEKQLTRLFKMSEDMTLAAYIRKEKVKYIEKLLSDKSMTLSEISETMGFPTESGFNAFFKKYNGMPPGEYRKMVTSGKT